MTIPDDRLKRLLDRAGVDPSKTLGTDAEGAFVTRRQYPRFEAEGEVRFRRPLERAEHAGRLADISRGGLSFLTDVSLAVGETVLLSYEEEGRSRSVQATVETIHAHPKDRNFLVGARFVR